MAKKKPVAETLDHTADAIEAMLQAMVARDEAIEALRLFADCYAEYRAVESALRVSHLKAYDLVKKHDKESAKPMVLESKDAEWALAGGN
jgi:hypothetical protein